MTCYRNPVTGRVESLVCGVRQLTPTTVQQIAVRPHERQPAYGPTRTKRCTPVLASRPLPTLVSVPLGFPSADLGGARLLCAGVDTQLQSYNELASGGRSLSGAPAPVSNSTAATAVAAAAAMAAAATAATTTQQQQQQQQQRADGASSRTSSFASNTAGDGMWPGSASSFLDAMAQQLRSACRGGGGGSDPTTGYVSSQGASGASTPSNFTFDMIASGQACTHARNVPRGRAPTRAH